MTRKECETFRFTKTSYLILRATETYTRTASGKSWKAHPDTVTREIITPEHYTNLITSVPFFNNFGFGASCRTTLNYTVAGYVPVTITTIAPYHETREVIHISFLSRDDLEKNAGYREKEIIKNATSFKEEYTPGNKRYYFFDSNECEIGIYNSTKKIWEG